MKIVRSFSQHIVVYFAAIKRFWALQITFFIIVLNFDRKFNSTLLNCAWIEFFEYYFMKLLSKIIYSVISTKITMNKITSLCKGNIIYMIIFMLSIYTTFSFQDVGNVSMESFMQKHRPYFYMIVITWMSASIWHRYEYVQLSTICR